MKNNNHEEKMFLTAEGLTGLKKEYENLVKVERPAIAERIARAREMGDLSENAEYDAAKDRQSFVEGRIAELEMILKNAQVIKHKASVSIIEVGTKVTVEIDGEEDTYTIVGSVEAKPEDGKISNESPVGKALLGLKEGDNVDVVTPHATLHYRIRKIHF